MNQFSSSACRFGNILLFGRVRLGWLLLVFSFLASQPVFGTDDFWTGAQDQRGSNPNNWLGGAIPGAGDNAVFNRPFPNQPTVDVSGTVGGIWMTVGIGQNVSIGGTNVLTLGGNTINGTGGLGILVDNTNAFTLTINAPIALGAAQTWRNSSANVLTIGAVNTSTFALTVDGSGGTTISGAVSGTGSLTKSGAGTLTLSGANTYSGATTLTSGTLNINNATALGTNAFSINGGTIDNTTAGSITTTTSNAITFGGNFAFGGTRNLTFGAGAITNGGNRIITLNGTNSTLTFGGIMTNTSNNLQTTTVNGPGNTLSLGGYALSANGTPHTGVINGSGNVTITGAVTNGGTASGSGLTYSGSGRLTLSGTNTYTGATTVNSGTLLVNGSTAAGSTVSVNNSGTTLGGIGTINGAVNVGNGAILLGGTGGAASGTLTLKNSLTLSNGSIIELALGATPGAHSTITRMGISSWTFDAHQAFTFINLGVVPGTTYTNIITGLGSDPGTESTWAITNAGWSGSFSYSGGNISVDIVAVPEPATYLAGFLAVLALGYHQRRRLHSLLLRQV
jgi:autotransporter-associated beta strand protein